MERRNSQEIPAAPPQAPAKRPSQTMGTRRTMLRMMKRQSVGLVAVYEQDPQASEAGTRTLVFEMLTGKVRVTHFPPDWQRLTDDELSRIRRSAN